MRREVGIKCETTVCCSLSLSFPLLNSLDNYITHITLSMISLSPSHLSLRLFPGDKPIHACTGQHPSDDICCTDTFCSLNLQHHTF